MTRRASVPLTFALSSYPRISRRGAVRYALLNRFLDLFGDLILLVRGRG